ncbi:RND transporter, partial [Aurantiacibacter xanthus]
VARAQLLPLVRLTGSIGTGPVTAGNLFDLVTGGLVGSISQLLFDGGRTAAQVDSAEAAAEAALAQWEGAILSALEEVESAGVARRTADERVTINEEALDAANNSAILARSQYEAGLIDFRTLLTAESALLSARNQLVTAEADRASAFVQLTQALGGGWSDDAYDFPLSGSAQSPSDRTDP